MSAVRVHNIGISLDGFGTGEGQSLETPFGHAGMRLMGWYFPTATFQRLSGNRERGPIDPAAEPDEAFARRGWEGIGVEIMGANKFGPPGWQDDPDWRGWWGDEPPFHTPVVVLTHHPRPPLELTGTTFHFLDSSPEDALAYARELAGGLDVRLGGGPTTIREFLAADLVDYLHTITAPIVIGRGVPLWEGLEGVHRRFAVESVAVPSGAVHHFFRRR